MNDDGNLVGSIFKKLEFDHLINKKPFSMPIYIERDLTSFQDEYDIDPAKSYHCMGI